MKASYFTTTAAIEACAYTLADGQDWSPTTIRCWINDELDNLERAGFKVNHDYNQPRAIRAVRSRIMEIRRNRRNIGA